MLNLLKEQYMIRIRRTTARRHKIVRILATLRVLIESDTAERCVTAGSDGCVEGSVFISVCRCGDDLQCPLAHTKHTR